MLQIAPSFFAGIPSSDLATTYHYFCAVSEYFRNFLGSKSYQNILLIVQFNYSLREIVCPSSNPRSRCMTTIYH